MKAPRLLSATWMVTVPQISRSFTAVVYSSRGTTIVRYKVFPEGEEQPLEDRAVWVSGWKGRRLRQTKDHRELEAAAPAKGCGS